MTTSSVDREVLRAWRDTHNDIQPDRVGHKCSRWIVSVDGAKRCADASQWWGRGDPFCERHMVARILLWSEAEREEVPA